MHILAALGAVSVSLAVNMPPKRARRSTPPQMPGAGYSTKLDLFAREFQTEDKLRRVLADLLRKIGHEGVRITHGTNEKGKDIVFYCDGPLGEKRLFACVVKNGPITGQAEDLRTGAPTLVHRILQGVINQIQEAFSEPLPSGRGVDQWEQEFLSMRAAHTLHLETVRLYIFLPIGHYSRCRGSRLEGARIRIPAVERSLATRLKPSTYNEPLAGFSWPGVHSAPLQSMPAFLTAFRWHFAGQSNQHFLKIETTAQATETRASKNLLYGTRSMRAGSCVAQAQPVV
jgi:hypothetical protein